VLDPVFRKYTLEDGRIRDVAKDLGHFKSAKVLQSMIICKQPRIGGVGESSWFRMNVILTDGSPMPQ